MIIHCTAFLLKLSFNLRKKKKAADSEQNKKLLSLEFSLFFTEQLN